MFSCCRRKYKESSSSSDDIIIALNDSCSYLHYITNYDSIPYFIPIIKYAKVTDVRNDYMIVVAAKLPIKNSPIYRFPVKLKGVDVCVASTDELKRGLGSLLDYKAKDMLHPFIYSTIVELKNIENYNGQLYADVYSYETHINQWLIDNKLAVRYDRRKELSSINYEKKRII